MNRAVAGLSRYADRMWYGGRWPGVLLSPLSFIYGVYAGFIADRHRRAVSSLPVVVVGNLTVGGTGKTPLVIHLVRKLREAGLRPGVVSRGYGACSGAFPRRVDDDSTAQTVGDEALLVYEKTGCPVVVDPDRPAAVSRLADDGDADVVLSDDGMQHYRLHRDLQIVVVDGERGFGNGMLLPAGPLRAPQETLDRVPFVLRNGGSAAHFELNLVGFVNLRSGERRALDGFAGTAVHACAGIGKPEAFFRRLEDLDMRVTRHPLADHASYTPDTLAFTPMRPIIMTEKDAVKCRDFADENVWVAETELRMHPGLESVIIERIVKGVERRRERAQA